MSEFIFMLTRSDVTVPDCLEVYDSIRTCDLKWVGFKDVGQPVSVLRTLTHRIHADGRRAVLEVVSIDEASELGSVRAGLDIGVDLIMGGTRPSLVVPLVAERAVRYFPFPGEIVGHPSVLRGSIDQIVKSAADFSALSGVDGLDLLAYRFDGDVPDLVRRVVQASSGPVVAAGSIDSAERIAVVTAAGAWGFTIGSSVFDGSFAPGASLIEAIDLALAIAGQEKPTRFAPTPELAGAMAERGESPDNRDGHGAAGRAPRPVLDR